ncbi:MAG TPA: DNA replication and repair protein RecF [Thermomicrobiales bacterium]|nr:DNA replication and repair protein RecF [Thermomicrobiales bacterium]
MYLTRLQLEQFRLYEHLELDIPLDGLRLSGRNASGKTSVLEALVLLSTTRSPRTSADRELVRWGSGEEYGVPPYARLEAQVFTTNRVNRVGINLEIDAERQLNQRKEYMLNGDQVRALDLVGVLKTVLFTPEDVLLVTGTPAERRRQLDIFVSQFDRAYLTSLAQFTRVLAQRNQLLKRYARERRSERDPAAVTEMSFWDDQLISSGAYVVATRLQVVRELSIEMGRRSEALVDGASVGMAYQPRLTWEGDGSEYGNKVLRESVAARFAKDIDAARRDEYRRGMTLVGPHRDEISFLIDGRSLSAYGSRGQQRLGVVAFRLAQIGILEAHTGERPVLLLDDVFSELDDMHRDMLIAAVTQFGCQVFLTSAEADVLGHSGLAHLRGADVEKGLIHLID